VIDLQGNAVVFRQLPTAALLSGVVCFLPAGSYLAVDVLLSEIRMAGRSPDGVAIDPRAMLISSEDRQGESGSGLRERIGSTLSGTGAALQRRVAREENVMFAADEPRLRPYVRPIQPLLQDLLHRRERVVIEGTQGFGLSLLHGQYPKVTSRDTTAAGFLSEVGLSPLDVDDVVLTLRTFPIRVPGNSGDLPHEVDWDCVTRESGARERLVEHTSVTGGVRRVGRFDAAVVKGALAANRPTKVVLNHLDYIDRSAFTLREPTVQVMRFVTKVETSIKYPIDYFGFSPSVLIAAESWRQKPKGQSVALKP
jgi:adenylosuccinate synthase